MICTMYCPFCSLFRPFTHSLNINNIYFSLFLFLFFSLTPNQQKKTHTTYTPNMHMVYSVKTDLHTGRAVSRLYIANANRNDSGNYSCALGDFARVTVSVHVLNGEYKCIYMYLSI